MHDADEVTEKDNPRVRSDSNLNSDNGVLKLRPRLVASSDADRSKDPSRNRSNYFKSAVWSPDGTCLITNSADNHIRTYIVPPDLLDQSRQTPHSPTAYSQIASFEAVNAFACYPLFSSAEPSTALILSIANDHPIRLTSAFYGHQVASYPLISPTTETFVKPHSLIFTPEGSRFLVGASSLIAAFDVDRPGEGPVATFRTGSRRARNTTEVTSWSYEDSSSSVSLRGLVSALAIDNGVGTGSGNETEAELGSGHGLLAAGTFSRQVGLYDLRGRGDCWSVLELPNSLGGGRIGEGGREGVDVGEEERSKKGSAGGGVSQLHWSPCGKYLYVFERKSDGAFVYDIRQGGHVLGYLTGRRADTNQRLNADLGLTTAAPLGKTRTKELGMTETLSEGNGRGDARERNESEEEEFQRRVKGRPGQEVWAGGLDGIVRCWKDPHLSEGAVRPSSQFKAHDDVVSGVAVHRSGGVLATCSGQRHFADFEKDIATNDGTKPKRRKGDNSLRIWAL